MPVGAETYFLASGIPAAHTGALQRLTTAVLARVERSVGYARAGDAAGAGAAFHAGWICHGSAAAGGAQPACCHSG